MSGVRYVTFDCYDTLVDYTRAKARAIRDLAAARDVEAVPLVAAFEAAEREIQATSFMPLTEVLVEAVARAFAAVGSRAATGDAAGVELAVRQAPAFADVAPALSAIRTRFSTAVLSNSQEAIIADNLAMIGVPFDQVVLAAHAGCYKPDYGMFRLLLERCGCRTDEILHVAQGFYHDIEPAHALGIRRVWINRFAKTGDPAFGPYEEFSDLAPLPALLGL